MSKVRAFIYTMLLFIVIFALLCATIFIDELYEINLFQFITSWMAGVYLGDKCCDFYKWLLKIRQ